MREAMSSAEIAYTKYCACTRIHGMGYFYGAKHAIEMERSGIEMRTAHSEGDIRGVRHDDTCDFCRFVVF